MKHTNKK